MNKTVFMQLLALSLYTLMVGFCFCDGFKLHISRKLIWSFLFLWISLLVYKIKGGYDLSFILPASCLLAILFCYSEKKKPK